MSECKNIYCYNNCDAYEGFCANTEERPFDFNGCLTRKLYEQSFGGGPEDESEYVFDENGKVERVEE